MESLRLSTREDAVKVEGHQGTRDVQLALMIGRHYETMQLNVIARRYNTTALCNTAGTGTLRYCA